MSENNEKCQSMFDKAQDEVLRSLVFLETHRYLVYCHRGANTLENIHMKELEFNFSFLKCTQTQTD